MRQLFLYRALLIFQCGCLSCATRSKKSVYRIPNEPDNREKYGGQQADDDADHRQPRTGTHIRVDD